RLIHIERGAFVFGFFGAVPEPEGFEPWFTAIKDLWAGQQPFGEEGGEMLVGSSDRQSMPHIGSLHHLQSCSRTRLPGVYQAVFFNLGVEQGVQAAVGGFLTNKALDFRFEGSLLVGGQDLETVADSI